MSAHDRYILAIALLDGDREARKILADLLEEQGDRGLAQWARGGGNARHRRLEFALMLLPCRDAIAPPRPSLTVTATVNEPSVAYAWLGERPLPVVWSPKSQS